MIVALAAAGLVAGCSAAQSGSPSPVTSRTGGTATGPTSGAPAIGDIPRVANPLQTDTFEQEPCRLLTSAQAVGLAQMTKVKPDLNGTYGPTCDWSGADGGGLSIGFVRNAGGLEGVYSRAKTGGLAVFIPVADVAGYPGAFADVIDARARGRCAITVAVRDDQALVSSTIFVGSSPHKAEACAIAQKGAELAIETMKAGA